MTLRPRFSPGLLLSVSLAAVVHQGWLAVSLEPYEVQTIQRSSFGNTVGP